MGFGPFFSTSFLSHELGLIKPDPEIFAHVVGALGCSPDRILFLDDNRLNVEAARAAGMVAHRVTGPAEAGALLRALGLLDEEPAQADSTVAGTPPVASARR